MATVILPKKPKHERSIIDPRDLTKPLLCLEPTKHTMEVPLDISRPNRVIKVELELLEKEREQLVNLLTENTNIFAWSPADMPRIDRGVAHHYQNIGPQARSVKQKPRKLAPNRQRVVNDEVERLLAVGFIVEAKYPR